MSLNAVTFNGHKCATWFDWNLPNQPSRRTTSSPKGRWNPSLWVMARNASAELAEGDDLVFTDDDCEPPCWWLD